MAASKQSEILRAGYPAPQFELERLGDGPAALKDLLSNGPVLLAFYKATCPVCQMTLPFLERVHRNRTPGSLSIYGVSQDDPELTGAFNAHYGITFPTLLDTEESGYPVSNAYGLAHVPSLFLVEPDGAIGWSGEGFHKREFIALAARAGVDPFQPGEDVPEWKAG